MAEQTTDSGLVLPDTEEPEQVAAAREADARVPTRYVVLARVERDGDVLWEEVAREDGMTRRAAYSKFREDPNFIPTEKAPELQFQMVPERSWQPITRTLKIREPEIVDDGV